jgi:Holliday junction resolvase RusA-like endonuclease
MNKFTLTIPGEPMGKQRARTVKRGNFIGTYTPEKTVNYETLVKELYAVKKGQYFEGPVMVVLTAFYSIPKSTSKSKLSQMATGDIRPVKKPDCDNVLKIVCDALNGIAYKDDSQIVSAQVDKFYTEKEPRVFLEIMEV